MAKDEKQDYGVVARRREQGVGDLVMTSLWRWGRSSPRRMVFLLRVAWRLWRAKRRRLRHERQVNGTIPSVVAISPTMRCNYDCAGCYSRGRPTERARTLMRIACFFIGDFEMGSILGIIPAIRYAFAGATRYSVVLRQRTSASFNTLGNES